MPLSRRYGFGVLAIATIILWVTPAFVLIRPHIVAFESAVDRCFSLVANILRHVVDLVLSTASPSGWSPPIDRLGVVFDYPGLRARQRVYEARRIQRDHPIDLSVGRGLCLAA